MSSRFSIKEAMDGSTSRKNEIPRANLSVVDAVNRSRSKQRSIQLNDPTLTLAQKPTAARQLGADSSD